MDDTGVCSMEVEDDGPSEERLELEQQVGRLPNRAHMHPLYGKLSYRVLSLHDIRRETGSGCSWRRS